MKDRRILYCSAFFPHWTEIFRFYVTSWRWTLFTFIAWNLGHLKPEKNEWDFDANFLTARWVFERLSNVSILDLYRVNKSICDHLTFNKPKLHASSPCSVGFNNFARLAEVLLKLNFSADIHCRTEPALSPPHFTFSRAVLSSSLQLHFSALPRSRRCSLKFI